MENWKENPEAIEKDAPILRDFQMSLEDLYRGTTKRFNITKHIYSADGTCTTVGKLLEIQVQPGWRAGTKIIFPSEGDVKRPDLEPADMVFILREKPHAYFTREKHNLIYIADITLKQALCGVKLIIPTLDGEQTVVQINEPINTGKVHVFQSKGMPNTKTGTYGDLIVRFNILFPTSLDKSQKDFIKSAFQDITSWK